MRSSSAIVAGLLFLLSTCAVQAQTLIASQDFEGADLVGYSTLGGSFALNGADYLERGSNGSPFMFEQSVTGFSGSNFIGLEDIDGAGLADPHWLALTPITVAGYTSLSVSLLVAAPSLLATRYEEEDFLLIEYSLDGAGYTLLGRFVGSTGGGTLKHDANLDGTGDVSAGPAMQRYTYSLGSATGSSLVVRVRFSSAGSQEEMAFDDIRITGLPPVASSCGNGVVEGSEACDDGFKDACGACNATCTGAGTGSTCGDGITCSQTEACDDGFKDACGACNATCTGAGTGTCGDGASCGAGQACDAGGQSVVDACSGDCLAQTPDAGIVAQDASALAQDANTLAQDAGALAQDAGNLAQSDACGADCQGNPYGVDAGISSEGEADACGENCPGLEQVADADMPNSVEGEDEDEEEGEENEEDIDAIKGLVDADVDVGSAPQKHRGEGCSVSATPMRIGPNPRLLVLVALLLATARRRLARR
jgi:hypothetical protein